MVEPSPPYSSGPVSSLISITGIEVNLKSTNPAEGEIGTFDLEFHVYLNDYPSVELVSLFIVSIRPNCDTGLVTDF